MPLKAWRHALVWQSLARSQGFFGASELGQKSFLGFRALDSEKASIGLVGMSGLGVYRVRPGSAFGLTLGVRRPQGPLAVKKQFGREKEFTSKWS